MIDRSGRVVVMVDPLNYTPYYDINLCDALSAQGWKVEWLTSPYMFEIVHAPPSVVVRNVFLRFSCALMERVRWLERHPSIRRGIKAISYPFDLVRLDHELAARTAGIVHVQWALFPVIDAVFWKRWQKKGWKIVYTAHDVDGLDGTTPKILASSNRRLFRIADAVAAHSDRDCGHIVKFGVTPSHVRRIPQGTPGIFQPAQIKKHDAQRSLGINPGTPTILFFGLLKAYKDFSTLLQAMVSVRARIPNVVLLVAGKPLTSYESYERKIIELGLSDVVRWDRSYIPGSRVATYFAASDLVALPYRAASASAVLLNAYSHGLPAVATRVGAFPEMVEHRKTGLLVEPGAADELGEALVALLIDPQLAREMGKRAREYAASNHEWPLIGRLTSDIYNSL
ncbi:MAG TPA: glycosyltransferase family 4 protein [Gemmatimonadaceae bacterium]|nr:glycosyltransferase family 4 protein [Gemmatimonadaceae bacterium]